MNGTLYEAVAQFFGDIEGEILFVSKFSYTYLFNYNSLSVSAIYIQAPKIITDIASVATIERVVMCVKSFQYSNITVFIVHRLRRIVKTGISTLGFLQSFCTYVSETSGIHRRRK